MTEKTHTTVIAVLYATGFMYGLIGGRLTRHITNYAINRSFRWRYQGK